MAYCQSYNIISLFIVMHKQKRSLYIFSSVYGKSLHLTFLLYITLFIFHKHWRDTEFKATQKNRIFIRCFFRVKIYQFTIQLVLSTLLAVIIIGF